MVSPHGHRYLVDHGDVVATRRITAVGAASKVLILTTFALDDYAFDGLRDGASG